MKKIAICLILSLTLMLSGCYEVSYNSLDEYKEQINRVGFGFSDVEIDHPSYFLPSNTFLNDFDYIEGNYYSYKRGAFNDFFPNKRKPETSLITLKFSNDNYDSAKFFVLDKIPKYENYSYSYNNYQFYINKNFMDRFDYEHLPQIPNWFTAVCFNDDNNMICFLGFFNAYPELDSKYLNDLENNWKSFIDQYFGEYYNFAN